MPGGKATIVSFASLRHKRGKVEESVEIEGAPTLGALLARRGYPLPEVAIVFRNGARASLDDQIGDGDRIEIFPLIGGG